MNDLDAVNLALMLFRCGHRRVMIAHGYNHIYGGGKIAGTASWFGSMGMRPPLVQAWLASLTELGAGALLVLGLLTPFGGAGVVGVMAVAWIIAHRRQRVLHLPARSGLGVRHDARSCCGIVLGTVGPGEWSLDDAFDLTDDLTGTTGLLISAVAGGGGALVLLATCWRPPAKTD